MDQPFLLATGCMKCSHRVGERTSIVHGYGDAAARVMFVGAFPDSVGANQTGIPWTRSIVGQRMQLMLRALGLHVSFAADGQTPQLVGAYMTYVVRCATHSDRAATATEIANCSAYLWHEIRLINPYIIVPVGEMPTRLLCAKLLHTIPGDVATLHGQVFPVDQRLLVPMIDLMAITRDEAHTFAHVLAALLEPDQ